MRNALLGGILIGIFVINWLGVFVLPIAVAFYQCIALFFLMSWRGVNPQRAKSEFSQMQYNYNTSFLNKITKNMGIFTIQFGWTYITTTAIAVIVYFVKILIW